MELPVIIENKGSVWRASIPMLGGLSAEGRSRDEALHKIWQALWSYLAKVEVVTIEVQLPPHRLRPGSKQAVLRAAGKFAGDEEAMLKHIEEIYAERRRQREEVERELDLAEAQGD